MRKNTLLGVRVRILAFLNLAIGLLFSALLLANPISSGMGNHLYKIEYRGKVTWIYGTLHLGALQLTDAPDVMKALSQSSKLYVEWKSSPEQIGNSKYHFLPGSQTIQDYLSSAQKEKLIGFLTDGFKKYWHLHDPEIIKDQLSYLFQMKPGLVYKLMNEFLDKEENDRLVKIGLRKLTRDSLDLQIYAFAVLAGLKIEGLRDSNYLIDNFFLKAIDINELKKEIDEALDDSGRIRQSRIDSIARFDQTHRTYIQTIAEMYKAGRPVNEILEFEEKFISTNSSIDPAINTTPQRIFNQVARQAHSQWIDTILKEIQTGGSFIAFGLFHLEGGKDKVIEIIRTKLKDKVRIKKQGLQTLSCQKVTE